MTPSKNHVRQVDFGHCRVCGAALDEEEYHLGLGRCKDCARKCDEEVGFGTKYGNVAEQDSSAQQRDVEPESVDSAA